MRRDDEISGAGRKPCARCRKPISVNKDFCADCMTAELKSTEARKGAPELGSTHVMIVHDSQDQRDLYRANGMLVASQQNDMVRFGQDVGTAQTRCFLNRDCAVAFLVTLAKLDLYAQLRAVDVREVAYEYPIIDEAPETPRIGAVVIEERQLERALLIPAAVKLN